MDIIEKAALAVDILKRNYPAECSLVYEHPWQLLFATRLSAQCTDERVNIVTKELFLRYKTIDEIADCDIEELCSIIRTCGLFRTKGRDIKQCAGVLRDKFGGEVPDTIEELIFLPGVGRKTANLIVGDIFKKPAIVADTHCIRISNRLGFVNSKDPYKVELGLKKIIEPSEQSGFCHRLVHFGRDKCRARTPLCKDCPLSSLCAEYSHCD